MTYVYHPKYGNDLPEVYFENNDSAPPNRIQLKAFGTSVESAYMRSPESGMPTAKDASKLEPFVPFTKMAIPDFKADRSFQYALLCQSPGFTSATADALIAIFGDYIEFEVTPDKVIAETPLKLSAASEERNLADPSDITDLSITLQDGSIVDGHYGVANGMVTVWTSRGVKSTQLGASSAEWLARRMLRELAVEAKQ
jgi:hypothetical protein